MITFLVLLLCQFEAQVDEAFQIIVRHTSVEPDTQPLILIHMVRRMKAVPLTQ